MKIFTLKVLLRRGQVKQLRDSDAYDLARLRNLSVRLHAKQIRFAKPIMLSAANRREQTTQRNSQQAVRNGGAKFYVLTTLS